MNVVNRQWRKSGTGRAVLLLVFSLSAVVAAGMHLMDSPVMRHGILPEQAALAGEDFWNFVDDADRDTLREVLMANSRELDPGLAGLLAEVIFTESRRHGFDPALVLAIIQTESSFRNRARSDRNALGLMQIMPATGEDIAREIDITWEGEASLYLPQVNVTMGIYYLRQLYERFEDLELALAAYNRGPGAVGRMIGRGRTPPAAYTERVLSAYRQFQLLFAPVTS